MLRYVKSVCSIPLAYRHDEHNFHEHYITKLAGSLASGKILSFQKHFEHISMFIFMLVHLRLAKYYIPSPLATIWPFVYMNQMGDK